ncbi:MAG: DUF4962 domain-containing protein [Planctomycetota bacterium]
MQRSVIYALVSGVFIVTALLGTLRAADPPHRENRTAASPAAAKVGVNPPPLLWPVTERSGMRYSVRLSRDKSFPAASTIAAEGLPWACFNAHRKLESGRWYWQYAVAGRDKKPAWSEVFWFDVDESAREFVTPTAEALLQACPAGHPRLLATAEELPELRRRAAGSDELKRIVGGADRFVGRELPAIDRARAKEKGADSFEQKNFAKWASKGYAGQYSEEVASLVCAYVLTGEPKYGEEAARRAVFIASLDPDGDTSPKVSDFADGSCMRLMALAYDSCYEFFSEAERQQLREAMNARADRFFGRQINNLEGRLFNAHIWQHILFEAGEVAFATLGEVPEAETWCAYFYELWVNRFPPMGGDDGGWAEGLNYEGVNFDTMLRVPSLFNRFAGTGSQDLYDLPWYHNAPYFMIYGWPPGSTSAGFGDGTEDKGEPGSSRAHFCEFFGRRFEDPYALWYADTVYEKSSRQGLPPLMLLHRLREMPGGTELSARSPRELPQARAFYDVGLVATHTDLTQPKQDVFLAFCSSPFGGSGHMHPCQNAFNVLVGGQRLFANSGYYIGYGDAHFKGWYSATRGHNAILIDGKGQSESSESYGQIVRFSDNPQRTYCLGDASNAYGDAGLTKARRHVAFLRPSTIVIYDDLEADHPAEWSWLLHSPGRITPSSEGVRLEAAVPTGRGQVDVMGSQPLNVSVDHRFDPPATNWRNKKSDGEVIEYPDQWHATVKPQARTGKVRYLAVLQVRLSGDDAAFEPVVSDGRGGVQVGPWRIEAALDPGKNASLVVADASGHTVLSVDENGQ